MLNKRKYGTKIYNREMINRVTRPKTHFFSIEKVRLDLNRLISNNNSFTFNQRIVDMGKLFDKLLDEYYDKEGI